LSPRHRPQSFSSIPQSPAHRRPAPGGRHRDGAAEPGTASANTLGRTSAAGRQPHRPRPVRSGARAPEIRSSRWKGIAAIAAVLTLVSSGVGLAAGSDPAADAATTHAAVTLAPVADTYATSASPTHIWGAANQVQAANRPGHLSTAYLKFQIPAVPDQSVATAELVLVRTNHHLSGTVRANLVGSASWSEKTLTAANAPAVGAVLDSHATNAQMHSVTFDVRKAVVIGSTITIALTMAPSSDFVAFRSREAGTGAPELRLSFSQTAAAVAAPSTSVAPSTSAESSMPAAPTTSAAPSTSASPAPSTSAAPSTSSSASSGGGQTGCTVSAKLVPSCGVWWGVAPKAHTSIPRDTALAEAEQEVQTPFTLMHTYHENDQLFPTATEQAMALEPGKNRVLLINWKPASDMTWAAAAAGKADARIDKLAAYIKSSFPYPFFLAIWHEPENDLNQTAGSGMTATDYAAMFRHVVLRLRADGATKPVIVMDYMGFDNWATQSWFPQLWPGDDVVDWIGIDPYGSGDVGVYKSGDFTKLVNRQITGFPGYYTWATTAHPGKPIMLAEWGVNESLTNPDGKPAYFDSVSAQIASFPAIKALVYFEENLPNATTAGTTTTWDSSPQSLAAFRQLAQYMTSRGPKPVYRSDNIEAM
jgi:hypothetical protein